MRILVSIKAMKSYPEIWMEETQGVSIQNFVVNKKGKNRQCVIGIMTW